jgi:hypothetical protein
MPDPYGNPTPQELFAANQQQQQTSFARAMQSGSKGAQAGASLAAIFNAPDNAKQQIALERRATATQEAMSEMGSIVDSMPSAVPYDVRQGQGMLLMADRLRRLGLTQEANNLSVQGNAALAAAEKARLERENLKARTAASGAQAARTIAETQYVGMTPHMQNVTTREQLNARLADETLTAEQRSTIERSMGHLDAKMLKDETITGRTEQDLRNDPVLMRKMFSDLGDNQVLLNNIDGAMTQFENLDTFEKTFWAEAQAGFFGFAEKYFGRETSESEREFMERIQTKKGKSALIAAKVRHALTGAQMSAFEIQYLEPFLPSPDDPVSVAVNKLHIVRDYTQMDTDTRMAMFQAGSTTSYFNNHQPGQDPATAALGDDGAATPRYTDGQVMRNDATGEEIRYNAATNTWESI